MSSPIPSKTQILVIGGGPAGSYAASCLVREGFDVTLLESAAFPRYHIGESFLPSVGPYLEYIDAFEKVSAFGFIPKPGGAVKFNQHKREGYTDFSQFTSKVATWHVTRADFDNILLQHAKECGVKVFEQTKVNEVGWEGDRPVSASYTSIHGSGTIAFDYVVDASGRTGIISTKYLKNRKMNPTLKNVAVWGYWKNCGRYKPGTNRQDAIFVEALTDESGWVWFIPLHDGTVSIGVVQHEENLNKKKKELRETAGKQDATLEDFYLQELELAPTLREIMTPKAELVQVGKDGGAHVKQASDYSYSATAYAGPGYRMAGDAGCFIDPFFSSGVHLAFTAAMSAAATIASSIRGIPEDDAIAWHNNKVGVAYTRFLVLVLGSYEQIRNQNMNVLSEIDEDNFDRAFDFIRPIIQGTADVNRRLTENEVEQSMTYMRDVFINKIADHETDDQITATNGENWNKTRGIWDSRTNFASEIINGYTVLLERGKFGMVKASEA